MRRLVAGILIFIAGWGLGWLTYQYRDADSRQPASPAVPVAADTGRTDAAATVTVPAMPVQGADITRLLQRNEFAAALERYESHRRQGDDVRLAEARTQILAYASRLISEHRFSLAEQLLQGFLLAEYRDVDARLLLAGCYQAQLDLPVAIDQLYEARGYAWQPDMLQRITARIHAVVSELTQSLQHNADQHGLLALYQHLIQLEPDHAPWFMELAAAQLALGDTAAARRSLLLVAQDPAVGAQAQARLTELNVALAGMQDAGAGDAASEVVGIPLTRSGNHFIVAARPANGRRIQLLVDTGATLTIVTPAALEQPGIRYQDTGRTAVFNTANGPVEGPVYRLDSLAVGGWQVRRLEIGVLDLGSRSGVDGLLGMNFLSHFQFFIDQNRALLRLSAN